MFSPNLNDLFGAHIDVILYHDQRTKDELSNFYQKKLLENKNKTLLMEVAGLYFYQWRNKTPTKRRLKCK
jgi:hypothetical protein